MTRAEEYIKNYTRSCSNKVCYEEGIGDLYEPWLTQDDALSAVEIAREEMMESACNAYCKVCGHYAHTVPTHICRHDCRYYSDFKKAMNYD